MKNLQNQECDNNKLTFQVQRLTGKAVRMPPMAFLLLNYKFKLILKQKTKKINFNVVKISYKLELMLAFVSILTCF